MERLSIKNITIRIRGLVQGVGFRPFVYRIAVRNNISGWVKNRADGVLIEASGEEAAVNSFVVHLRNNVPRAAQVQEFRVYNSDLLYKDGFRIILSEDDNPGNDITQIGPDIAVCADCLEDMNKQDHRIDYPFVNCTNCGPRFSIVRDLPYDRDKTTMDVFGMCLVCKSEYENPVDRRFHAQPVACNGCGPHYRFVSEELQTENLQEILQETAGLIDGGKLAAIKGIGGFFIACNATEAAAVKQVREKKGREGKPLAVMFKDLKTIRHFCFVDRVETKALESWQRPIVILRSKGLLPESVSRGLSTVGALLPYMPFHYQLFEKMNTPAIVFTSGNFSDEPIIKSNHVAETELSKICDAVVSYNRRIYNRTDDSLLQIINRKTRVMRRSRGFAPGPVYLDFDADGILATGAELKNTFCLGKRNQAILSQHIGDLKDFETYSFYEKNIGQFEKLFRVNLKRISCDLHSDYLSTRYAFESGLPLVRVQHHHGHIASAMAENSLDEKVIGVSFDGTGLGDDEKSWGSEFLVCDLAAYERKYHFEYIPLPGGDSATKAPWRIAVSWLYKVLGREFMKMDLPFLRNISPEEIKWVVKSIDNNINCPLSCGAGRLFDAVSALLGVCNYSTFEAEAPMRLENIAAENETGVYPYKFSQAIEFTGMFEAILRDIQQKVAAGIISARFHNTISEIIAEGVNSISLETGLKKVVLSGGTFQNKYLTERSENKLTESGFEVFGNCSVPCNDGGISLGQLVIAAKRRSLQLQPHLTENPKGI